MPSSTSWAVVVIMLAVVLLARTASMSKFSGTYVDRTVDDLRGTARHQGGLSRIDWDLRCAALDPWGVEQLGGHPVLTAAP